MPRKFIWGVYTVNGAVQKVTPYLGETDQRTAYKTIYFDGWDGLGASSVLRAIAEHPPTSLWRKKFDRIIHIDGSRWRSRRALQRTIADELKLPHNIMAAFDRQDMEDDFSGVDEDSRAEVPDVTREIYQTTKDFSCLVIFHNGNDSMVDLSNFGFPQFNWFSPYTVLWTFSGGLQINPEIKEKVDSSHLCIYKNISWSFDNDTAQLILEEATEVVRRTQYKQSITPEIAAKCITYILWLHEMGGGTMDYNWAAHASNYWVCDGIIGQQGQLYDDESWEVSTVLHNQVQRMDFSSRPVKFRGHEYVDVWKSATYTSDSGENENLIALSRNLTSFFLVLTTLPHEMFQQSERLRVLKLSRCRFSFYLPPFHCCCSLRFLGLDHCEDQRQEVEDKQGRPKIDFFQSLWVLDISHTDWELDLSSYLTEQTAPSNIREVYINKGRIWCNHLAWRQLQNLHKLQVIEPTSSWETGKKDEFADMGMLELLDLSGNSTIQVLPCLSSATCLKTLILDGCVGLDHVGPEGLPPSLESFSLDATSDKLLKISFSGCACLEVFLLRGELPGLEELNLSGTSVRRVDLSDKVVQVQGLKKVFLMGCKQLRAILWWEGTRQLEVLRIGTFETEDILPYYPDASSLCFQHKNYVVTGDARIIQSLLLEGNGTMITSNLYLDLHVPPTNCESKGIIRDEVIPKRYCYTGVLLEGVAIYDSEVKWPPPLDCHMDVGEGISLTDVESDKGSTAIRHLMLKCINSLHVHDNSGILDVTPPKLPSGGPSMYFVLKWCRVEKCPKLQAVFVCYHSQFRYHFRYLETIWASDLPEATCIWTEAIIYDTSDSFEALKSIHVHNCPRLKFVLPLIPGSTYLPSLETVHITGCNDLTQVFPWDNVDAPDGQHRKAMEFPKLKHILLHHLASLQEICEAKMSAPMLESVKVRGCWALRRLPAVGTQNSSHRRPAVHCEKDWWTKLEWDGLQAGHHPSHYEPCYSSAYYKKRFLRGTVLR